MSQPLISITKTLNLSFDQVRKALLDIEPGIFTREQAPLLLSSFAPITIQQSANAFTVFYGSGNKLFIQVDKLNNTITVDGEWWYRGYYKVEQTDKGAALTCEVHNIAPNLRWLVSLFIWNKKTRSGCEQNFNTLVELINLRKVNRSK